MRKTKIQMLDQRDVGGGSKATTPKPPSKGSSNADENE